MELLTCVCDAARRFRERSARDEDIAASLVELGVVATIRKFTLGEKLRQCRAVRRRGRLHRGVPSGNVPADTVRAFARATLDRVLSSSKRPGAALADKATRALVFIIERIPSHSWADAFYERDDLEWVRVALRDPWPRRRARVRDARRRRRSGFANRRRRRRHVSGRLRSRRRARARRARGPEDARRGVQMRRLTRRRKRRRREHRRRSRRRFVSRRRRAASSTPFLRYPCSPPPTSGARSRACSRGKPIQTTIARRCFVAAPPRRYSPPPASRARRRRGVDFNPNHEADGTMWHGAFGVLRAPSRDDDVVADDAHAAANVASLLGVVTAAGCKTMDAALAAARCAAVRRRVDAGASRRPTPPSRAPRRRAPRLWRRCSKPTRAVTVTANAT